MFERLEEEAKAAIADAHNRAKRSDADEVDSGHLLVALAHRPNTTAGAALADLAARPEDLQAQLNAYAEPVTFDDDDIDALASIGIDLREVERHLGDRVTPDQFSRPGGERQPRRWSSRFSSDFKRALADGFGEAIATSSDRIRCEDLLLGIVKNEESVGALVLRQRGIRPSDVREVIVRRRRMRG